MKKKRDPMDEVMIDLVALKTCPACRGKGIVPRCVANYVFKVLCDCVESVADDSR